LATRKKSTSLIGKRVAVCCYAPPRFDRDAGSRRLLDCIDFFREAGASVTFFAVRATESLQRYTRHLQQLGIAVYALPTDPVDQILASSDFDVALLTFWPVAERFMPLFRRSSPSTRLVIDSVDMHFLRDARRSIQITGPELPKFDRDYGEQFVGELNAYADADLVLTVSDKETGMLEEYLGATTPIRSVPLCEEIKLSRVPIKKRRGILFIGSSFHAPNTQAAQFLCQEIVPRVDQKLLERHPVVIVGDGMNTTDLGDSGDAEITSVGWVPSVVPYLQHARLSILPLLYGAGTKGKLIQALMAGTPTVSTRIGVEGFGLTPGEQVLVADDADGLASAVSDLLTNDDECERLIKHGREWVLGHHSRAVTKQAFLDAIQTALAQDPKPARAVEDPALFENRMTYQETQRFRDRLAGALGDIMPHGEALAVITGGSTELLRLLHRLALSERRSGQRGAGFHGGDRRGSRGPGQPEESRRRIPRRARALHGLAGGAPRVAGVPRRHISHGPRGCRARHRLFAAAAAGGHKVVAARGDRRAQASILSTCPPRGLGSSRARDRGAGRTRRRGVDRQVPCRGAVA
jgi:glycosyltransferase involved in cell wall biosynthesis